MSSSEVFVGGLSYATDDHRLREAFSGHGEVVEARLIMDLETGRSRGFGFVTFASGEEASGAISGMDGKDVDRRYIRVNYANDRTGGFHGGGGGGYGEGGGGSEYGDGGYGGGGGGGNYSGDGYNNAGYGGSAGDLAGGHGSSCSNYFGGATGNEFASGGSTDGATGYGDNISHQSGRLSSTGTEQNDNFDGNFRDDDDQPDDYASRRG